MPLSQKIQTLRKERNLTQEALADQLNVSRQALSKWELGVSTPEADKIVQLSEFFNVSTDYLLKETIDQQIPHKKSFSTPRLTIIRSTTVVLVGLIIALARGLDGASILYMSFRNVSLGLIVQVIGIFIFELLITYQSKNEHKMTRRTYYLINTWLLTLVPLILFFGWFDKFIFFIIPIRDELLRYAFLFTSYIGLNLLISFIIHRVYKSSSL